MTETKEKATTPMLSVDADNEQSLSKNLSSSVADEIPKINENLNLGDEAVKDYFNQMFSMDYLHTVSHSELLDTAFQPKAHIYLPERQR